ncbi:hypothetical protein DN524_32775, partial [Burkholderia multivorans]
SAAGCRIAAGDRSSGSGSGGTASHPDRDGVAEHAAASLPFRGLINDHALRWNAMTALVCLGWADQTDIARETHLDQSSSGRLRAETAVAPTPQSGGN